MKLMLTARTGLLALIAALFITVLNFSLPAEKDSTLSNLPVIPAPEDGRADLYKLLKPSTPPPEKEGLVSSIVTEQVVKDVPAVRAKDQLAKKQIELTNTGVPKFPLNLEPYKPRTYRYRAPDFYRGLYVTNPVARTPGRYSQIIDRGLPLGLNTLVVDVQPALPSAEFMEYAKKNNLYLVARVVVFEGGLKTYPAPLSHINKVLDQAEAAAKAGFAEIQLDYIRFADNLQMKGLTMDRRYKMMAGILRMSEDRLRPYGVRIGADIFGRIAFNKTDIIGQQIELYSKYMDTLYPMLYPSHFYGDPHRIKDPHGTIYDGMKNTMARSGSTRAIAYIQAFKMSVGPSRLSYVNYIKVQIQAAKKSGSAGYIAWNARNQYDPFFAAMKLAEK